MKDLNLSYYKDLSANALDQAKKLGATSAEMCINLEEGFSVSSRLCQVDTVEHQQSKSVAITVYINQQTGSANSSDLSPDAVKTAIEKACSIAKYTNSDPYTGLADENLMAFNYPELDLNHSWDISTEQALDLAIQCESAAMSDRRITNSEGVSVSSHNLFHLYANSHNFIGHYLASQHSLNCILIAQHEHEMHRDYDYTVARDPQELKTIEDLAETVKQKTLSRLGARRLKTQSVPVLFSADLARNLLGNFVKAISGSQIYRKSSFLTDCLGQQVLPTTFSLVQDPHIKKGIGSVPFDGEGVRTIKQAFVNQGVLEKYVLNSYSARKLGMETTGNAGGIYNLQVTDHPLPFQSLLKQMDKGLLVTELIGQGVNLVTGDYSRGAFGYWVENGVIQFPVEEITIAGNLKDMLLNIVAIGDDIDRRGRIQTGSILVEKMMVAGE